MASVGSMFDEHRDQIIEWVEQGYNFREIIELLPAGYSYGGLMDWVRVNKISQLIQRQKCNECVDMRRCESMNGQYTRICTVSWKVIPRNITRAPRWCEGRIKKISSDNPYQE